MEVLLNTIAEVNSVVNNFVWGPLMLTLLIGTGIYFTVRTGFLQITRAGFVVKNTFLTIFKGKGAKLAAGAISPFQALTTALAATVGTGNIVGVATAIVAGGPGAIFWMWISAFFGMMTKYAEIVLAVHYRKRNVKGEYVGGPMYYIEQGLGNKWLASIFALLGFIACFGIGNMTQANSISSAAKNTFGIPTLVTGILVAALTLMVIIGGIKRIASITEKFVPLMAMFYILAAIIILAINFEKVPETFALIFESAFKPAAAVGGFTGAAVKTAMQKGIARGIFSNEAGLGSAPMAHAAADTDHPIKQGVWGVFEVFIDTIVVCTCTALIILSTGVWNSGLDGAELTIAAFSTGIGSWAGFLVTLSIFLFAFSTLVSWSYYGEKCLEYLVGSSKYNLAYRIFYGFIIVIGATTELKLIWNISDTLNGCMAIPNLIGVLALSGVVFRLTKEFFQKKTHGEH